MLQERLAELADRHHIVGASLAIGVGDDTAVAATGVLNLRTGAPAGVESVFQIGSITKVWTATLVMQLVDEGLVDLDRPLVSYLPDFRVRDDDISARVTARHLLNHTSGIGGDFFPDTGRGDDCLARYVTEMSDLAACHPLGATMSYCNAGFVLLGRLVEVLRGQTWDAVMRERLFTPLGLTAAGTLPEDALLWGAAVGHFGTEVTANWGLPRGSGPSGLIHSRAEDLITFARLHLADGLSASGERVLSSDAAKAMRTAEAAIPEPWTSGTHVGLGWMLFDWGRPVFGHDGATLGQTAFLRVVPGPTPVAIALLVNGGHADQLYQDVFSELLAEHAGIGLPPPLQPPTRPVTSSSRDVVGLYERTSMSYVVEDRAGELVLIAQPSGVLAAALGTSEIEGPLIPFAPDTFLTQVPGRPGWLPAKFYRLSDGTEYMHLGGVAARRANGRHP